MIPLETKLTSVRAPQAGHALAGPTVIPPITGFSGSELVQPLVSKGLPKAVSNSFAYARHQFIHLLNVDGIWRHSVWNLRS